MSQIKVIKGLLPYHLLFLKKLNMFDWVIWIILCSQQIISLGQCIYLLKEVIDVNKSHNSPMFLCYMDASKASDGINHWTITWRDPSNIC